MSKRRRNAAVVVLGLLLGLGLLVVLWGEQAPEPSKPRSREVATRSRSAPPPGRPSAASAPSEPDAPALAPEEVPPARVEAPDEVLVHVLLVHADGSPEPEARIRPDCDGIRLVSRAPGAVVFAMPPGRCLVEGIRPDGLLATRAPEVEVAGEAGDEIDVSLVFPTERTGGIGIGIEEVPEGVLVTYIHPGSPADQAGLQEGDIIVEVDGLATSTLELTEFVSVMTGPEDTPIAFVLAGESDTGVFEEELELIRAFLPDDRDS